MSLDDPMGTFDNVTVECPNFSEYQQNLLGEITFWVDGVIVGIMAFTGLIANIISALILGK